MVELGAKLWTAAGIAALALLEATLALLVRHPATFLL
jgi:hypothetical protein